MLLVVLVKILLGLNGVREPKITIIRMGHVPRTGGLWMLE